MAEFVQVIDPGHGGHDPGAVANGLREKDLTLKIALYTRDYIHQLYQGVKVYLTREKDVFIGLSERADFANRLNADHFCSIHINASGRGGRGFESYIYNGSYPSKPKTQALRNVLHDTIVSETGFYNHGKKEANLAVLRETNMPAVLTENGYIDNLSDAAFLKSDANLRKIALAHAHGLAKAHGWKAKPNKQPSPQSSSPSKGKVFYRVITGSFENRENAEQRVKELKAKGFDSFIDVYKK